MKNSTIAQALSLGFSFENFSDEDNLKDVHQSMMDFFNENYEKLEQLEDRAEVNSDGRSQYVNYGDFSSSGEIVSFSENWHKAPDTKVFHSNFVMENNGLMVNMNLYYLVGETDYNAPDGFHYDSKNKCHVKDEEITESE